MGLEAGVRSRIGARDKGWGWSQELESGVGTRIRGGVGVRTGVDIGIRGGVGARG